MKKKVILVLVGTLCLTLSVGCNKEVKKENKTIKEEKINGNCSAIDCMKKLNTSNTVEEINKVIGIDGTLTDEKYNKYTWKISDTDEITAAYYSSSKANITATYDKNTLKNSKVDFSKYNEIKTALKNGEAVSYNDFKEKVGGVDGTLVEISSISNKYTWVNKDGGYLTATFSNTSDKCTFIVGRF